MNLALVPLTMKLPFLLSNLHLKHHAEKEKIRHSPRKTPFDWKIRIWNGTASAQQNIQSSHGAIGESTVRLFKRKYEAMIKDAARKKVFPKKAIAAGKRGRPILLGEINKMVQRFLLAVRKKRRSCKYCCCQISCSGPSKMQWTEGAGSYRSR